MTALLTAIAILIPIIMPLKNRYPTGFLHLGKSYPIFIAMFLSPLMVAFVIIASSLGFSDGRLSACYCTPCLLSHRFWYFGVLYLKKFPETLDKTKGILDF